MHCEIMGSPDAPRVDSLQFHVSSSLKKAEEYVRSMGVEAHSWWQVHPHVVDADDEGDEVHYFSHRGTRLKSAPMDRAIKAFHKHVARSIPSSTHRKRRQAIRPGLGNVSKRAIEGHGSRWRASGRGAYLSSRSSHRLPVRKHLDRRVNDVLEPWASSIPQTPASARAMLPTQQQYAGPMGNRNIKNPEHAKAAARSPVLRAGSHFQLTSLTYPYQRAGFASHIGQHGMMKAAPRNACQPNDVRSPN